MATHHSADARTALLVAYIARYGNPQGGRPLARAKLYPPQRRGLEVDGRIVVSKDALGAQGRTIYNADTHPINQGDQEDKGGVLRELERIDEEEERLRKHWDQFLIAARGDFEEEGNASSSSLLTMSETTDEMFALYIRDV